MPKWYKESGNNSDVIISSRVRLARNLDKYPFAIKLTDDKANKLIEEVNQLTSILTDNTSNEFYNCSVDKLSDIDKVAMVERHIISPLLIEKEQPTGLILSADEKISIMINEEDHIRIQSITGGMNMEEAFIAANQVDDMVNEILPYAYHEKYGYLSSCPTNVRAGLRASYMVFLPALQASRKIEKLTEELGQYGIALRGTYGEASKSLGSLYQISNQKTLGSTEQDIMNGLNRIVEQVMKQERRQREYMLSTSVDEITDKVHRSYGILRYAKQLNATEAMTLLSQVKLGTDLGLIKLLEEPLEESDASSKQRKLNIHELMMEIQPGNLSCKVEKHLGSVQRDKYRAEYIKSKLPSLIS